MKAVEETLSPQSWGGGDDIVIIGGGLAGLFCALKLSPRPVTIVTAAPIGEGASNVAGGSLPQVPKGRHDLRLQGPEHHRSARTTEGAALRGMSDANVPVHTKRTGRRGSWAPAQGFMAPPPSRGRAGRLGTA